MTDQRSAADARLCDRAVDLVTAAGTRRTLILSTAAVTLVLIAASVAWACTTYQGVLTIENLDRGSEGELTVVANSEDAMDRCEGAGTYDGSSDNVTAHNGKGNNSSKGPDTIRVEINEYSNTDCDGPHSMADHGPVEINVLDGDAYHDDDGDGKWEDNDCGLLTCDTSGSDDGSHERIDDCMDGGASDTINKKSGIAVTSGGQFDTSDTDGDGVNDVDITIDTAQDNTIEDDDPSGGDGVNDYASAICVAEDGGIDYSAPQIPILIK